MTCSAPPDCAEIERRHATGNGLLLDGGASRGNLLSGEADRTRRSKQIAACRDRLTAEGIDLALDITSDDDWAGAVRHVETTWGGLDLLVNNAGIGGGGRIVRRSRRPHADLTRPWPLAPSPWPLAPRP